MRLSDLPPFLRVEQAQELTQLGRTCRRAPQRRARHLVHWSFQSMVAIGTGLTGAVLVLRSMAHRWRAGDPLDLPTLPGETLAGRTVPGHRSSSGGLGTGIRVPAAPCRL